jgi:hypothetical protein
MIINKLTWRETLTNIDLSLKSQLLNSGTAIGHLIWYMLGYNKCDNVMKYFIVRFNFELCQNNEGSITN